MEHSGLRYYAQENLTEGIRLLGCCSVDGNTGDYGRDAWLPYHGETKQATGKEPKLVDLVQEVVGAVATVYFHSHVDSQSNGLSHCDANAEGESVSRERGQIDSVQKRVCLRSNIEGGYEIEEDILRYPLDLKHWRVRSYEASLA